MSLEDAFGYAASAAVLATFCMSTMIALRIVALVSNVLFIAYGFVDHLYPVFMLHAILFPVNALRVVQLQHAPKLGCDMCSTDARRSFSLEIRQLMRLR